MLKRLLIAFATAIGAYVIGAAVGGALISWLSSNTHDRSIEAAMTGAFVTGPLAAIIGFVVALVLTGRGTTVPPADRG